MKLQDCVMAALENKTVILVTQQVEFLSEVDKILANFYQVLKVKLNFKFCMHKFLLPISNSILFLNFPGYEWWSNY